MAHFCLFLKFPNKTNTNESKNKPSRIGKKFTKLPLDNF